MKENVLNQLQVQNLRGFLFLTKEICIIKLENNINHIWDLLDSNEEWEKYGGINIIEKFYYRDFVNLVNFLLR